MNKIYDIREKFVDSLWNMSSNSSLSVDDWHAEAKPYFDQMARVMFKAYQHQFITADEIGNRSHVARWTFPASIFFATTVITTIGTKNLHVTPMKAMVRFMYFKIQHSVIKDLENFP